jgi:hypothetical protein
MAKIAPGQIGRNIGHHRFSSSKGACLLHVAAPAVPKVEYKEGISEAGPLRPVPGGGPAADRCPAQRLCRPPLRFGPCPNPLHLPVDPHRCASTFGPAPFGPRDGPRWAASRPKVRNMSRRKEKPRRGPDRLARRFDDLFLWTTDLEIGSLLRGLRDFTASSRRRPGWCRR